MNKIKILVGYHRPSILFKSDILVPIHLGRAIALKSSKDGIMNRKDYDWMLNHMIGDDTGDNISDKNRLFAELTGIYWAWKNYKALGNPDYIGFMHYKRLFNFSADEQDKSFKGLVDSTIKNAVSGYDLVLPVKLGAWSQTKHQFIDDVYSQYSIEHPKKDIDLFIEILKELHPEMSDAVDKVLHHSPKICWYGIFVMKRKLFMEYIPFVFDIFNELAKRSQWESYPVTLQRVCGYLNEFLINIFKEYRGSSSQIKSVHYPLYFIDSKKQKPLLFGSDIHVCFGTDNNYVEHTAAALASVLAHANALDRYHFHILSTNVSRTNKLRLKNIRKFRAFDIDFLHIDEKQLSLFKQVRLVIYLNLSSCHRLLIPRTLPKVDKVIYLDSDLVAVQDINELFSIDMGDNWVAGVEDVNATNLAKCIHLPDNKYINSGVLVLNARELRHNDYERIMLETIKKNGKSYYLGDQDILNDSFHDKIALISYRFNMFHKFHNRFSTFKPSDASDFEDSCNNPVIVHYVGPKKPWNSPDHPCRDLYFRALALTPWKEGKESPPFRFSLYEHVKRPDLHEVRFLGIPLKTVRIHPQKITRRILGLLYYKKYISPDGEKEYKFFKLRQRELKREIIKLPTPPPPTPPRQKEQKKPKVIQSPASPLPNNTQNFQQQIWRKFIHPYTVYGVSESMLEVAKGFTGMTSDTRMHVLYIAMLFESGKEGKALEELSSYTKKFGDGDLDKKLNLANFADLNGYHSYKNVRDTAEIYREFERNTQSTLLYSLLSEKSVAVVGNGPSHVGKKCGSEIDAHDIVIRMNNYVTSPEYREDYGSKTDIWLVGCGGDDVILRREPYKAVIFGQDVRVFWGYHSDFYRYFILEKRIPCLYISRKIIDEFCKKFGILFSTTGANLIYMLSLILPNFRQIHFYGFNFCTDKPDNYASHYFREKQTMRERLGRSEGHDFLHEASALSRLIQSMM